MELRQVRKRTERLLTVQEVARILGVSVATVWRHTKCGTLPEPIKIGGATRWVESEICDAINKRKDARHRAPPGVDFEFHRQTAPTKKRDRVRLAEAPGRQAGLGSQKATNA